MTQAKLTPRGEALVKKLREEREANIEAHNGEYVPDPWYKYYLSPGFKIPENSYVAGQGETDMAAYELIEKSMGKKSRRHKDDEDDFEESTDADEFFLAEQEENGSDDDD